MLWGRLRDPFWSDFGSQNVEKCGLRLRMVPGRLQGPLYSEPPVDFGGILGSKKIPPRAYRYFLRAFWSQTGQKTLKIMVENVCCSRYPDFHDF